MTLKIRMSTSDDTTIRNIESFSVFKDVTVIKPTGADFTSFIFFNTENIQSIELVK